MAGTLELDGDNAIKTIETNITTEHGSSNAQRECNREEQ